MLKRISVTQLRLGMFVKEFCGSWIEHPFWFSRSAFLLDDPRDLQRIQASSIKEVWIDSARGADVAEGVEFVSEAETHGEAEAALREALGAGPQLLVPIEEEYERAAMICARSRKAVTAMFHEARMGKAVDSRQVEQLVDDISQSILRNPGALVSLARLKSADDYTYMHSVAVCALMIALGRQLKLGEEVLRRIGVAGLLHDLGKAKIPMDIINKPGRLSDEEFQIIKAHPEEGYRLLVDGSGVCELVLDVVLHHHEKMDGSGYPKGLKGEQISLYARMGAICDVYDAVTSNRPYKAGWDPAESLRKMAEWTGGHFDKRVFQAFVKSVGIYPVGSLVRLESRRLGIVIEQAAGSLLEPRIRAFYSIERDCYIAPEVIDLAAPGCAERIVGREDPAKWGFVNLEALWLS